MRATKLLSSTKNLSYKERLTTLNLPTLKYRRLRGDMIEMYKIITNKQDGDVTLKFNIIPAAITRGGHPPHHLMLGGRAAAAVAVTSSVGLTLNSHTELLHEPSCNHHWHGHAPV